MYFTCIPKYFHSSNEKIFTMSLKEHARVVSGLKL